MATAGPSNDKTRFVLMIEGDNRQAVIAGVEQVLERLKAGCDSQWASITPAEYNFHLAPAPSLTSAEWKNWLNLTLWDMKR